LLREISIEIAGPAVNHRLAWPVRLGARTGA
jgi:hypothetical protein